MIKIAPPVYLVLRVSANGFGLLWLLVSALCALFGWDARFLAMVLLPPIYFVVYTMICHNDAMDAWRASCREWEMLNAYRTGIERGLMGAPKERE